VATVLEATIRCCLFCVGLGTLDESATVNGLPVSPEREAGRHTTAAIGQAVYQASLGAAVDLDPMSIGPAHLALPATVAALVAAEFLQKQSDEAVASAVLAGIEAGSRLRDSVRRGRPGSGFHSAGTFGTIAAAASVARLMDLPPTEFANAIGIAFTRMSGLAINAAFTRICLTHFGWAAGHGLEAAWLAANGWGASLNAPAALRAFFPDSPIDVEKLRPREGEELLFGADSILFKRYPCNAYLNPLVIGLSGSTASIDRVEVRMPAIGHLNRPDPKDIREARYSAQAVAAISMLYPPVYASFTDGVLNLGRNQALKEAMDRVTLIMDDQAPTSLADASIQIKAWSGGRQVLETTEQLRQLTPWSLSHALELLRGRPTGWVTRLYGLPYAKAYGLATDRAELANSQT
jgi:2-methylcitrate dehydratase PrpD